MITPLEVARWALATVVLGAAAWAVAPRRVEAGAIGGDRASDEDASVLDAGPHADPEGMFVRKVFPVLEARCLSCHGRSRRQGGLALHTPGAILAGGESGPALRPGDAWGSELLRRLRLPAGHADRMPPKGRVAPTEAEIAAIESWIEAGAPWGPER